jgi:hypothetical protein
MNKREIVKNVIAHKESSELPFCIHFALDAKEKYYAMLFEDYVDDKLKKEYDEGRLSLDETIRIGIGNYVIAQDCPWWSWYDVPSSYSGFDAPDVLPKTIGYGSYNGYVEHLKYLKETTGCYIMVNIYGSHFEKAYFARGIENFLADMAGEPDFAKRLLDTIIRKNMVMLENIVNIPEIDGILLGSDWGSQNSLLMSPSSWRELIAPGEKLEYDLIHSTGKDVWVHSCGNVEQIMGDLIELGVDVLNPLQPECMDIKSIKSNYGNKLTFWGGISTQQTLPYGKADDVRNEILTVTDFMKESGGYILAPSQEIQSDVPYENLRMMIDTARDLSFLKQ